MYLSGLDTSSTIEPIMRMEMALMQNQEEMQSIQDSQDIQEKQCIQAIWRIVSNIIDSRGDTRKKEEWNNVVKQAIVRTTNEFKAAIPPGDSRQGFDIPQLNKIMIGEQLASNKYTLTEMLDKNSTRLDTEILSLVNTLYIFHQICENRAIEIVSNYYEDMLLKPKMFGLRRRVEMILPSVECISAEEKKELDAMLFVLEITVSHLMSTGMCLSKKYWDNYALAKKIFMERLQNAIEPVPVDQQDNWAYVVEEAKKLTADTKYIITDDLYEKFTELLYKTLLITQGRAINLLSEYYGRVIKYGQQCESKRLELLLKEVSGVSSKDREILVKILQDMERLSPEVQLEKGTWFRFCF